MNEHKPRKVTTGLPTNGPEKPMAVDCSCGWKGMLFSRKDPTSNQEAKAAWETHKAEAL
jgi:hypothetical protein